MFARSRGRAPARRASQVIALRLPRRAAAPPPNRDPVRHELAPARVCDLPVDDPGVFRGATTFRTLATWCRNRGPPPLGSCAGAQAKADAATPAPGTGPGDHLSGRHIGHERDNSHSSGTARSSRSLAKSRYARSRPAMWQRRGTALLSSRPRASGAFADS